MSDNILEITRIFNAPRELVWKAWEDNELMNKWSCPTGFKMFFGERNFKPNGFYRFGMEAPDGSRHIAGGIYKEIDKPKRLVFTHGWEDEAGKVKTITLVTVTFSEENGKTTMLFRQEGFDSADSRNGHMGGWSQSFDKLETILK